MNIIKLLYDYDTDIEYKRDWMHLRVDTMVMVITELCHGILPTPRRISNETSQERLETKESYIVTLVSTFSRMIRKILI